MRYTLVLLFTLCASTIAIAQNTNTKEYYAKAYANGSISPFTTPTIFYNTYMGYRQHTKLVNVLSPSVAFTIRNKRGNMHEIEWNKLNINTTIIQAQFKDPITGTNYFRNNQKLHTTTIALRYEYIRRFAKNKLWKLQPSLGLAAMPYYNRYNSKPFSSIDIPTSQTAIGFKSFIVPRVNIALSKHMVLDVNIPLCVLDIGTMRQKMLDPTLPARSQVYSLADLSVFPQYYTARIGLMVKL